MPLPVSQRLLLIGLRSAGCSYLMDSAFLPRQHLSMNFLRQHYGRGAQAPINRTFLLMFLINVSRNRRR